MANAVDAAMFTWLWDTMPRGVAAGDNPYRTDLIFHPVGADLEMTTSAPLVGLLTWPVRWALGPVAQVNVLQLASMFLAGLTTYLLAERLSRHRGAAFVAGIAYALLPARFVHMEGSLNLIETAVIPLGLLLFLRLLDTPTWRRAAALGVACGATFLTDPQLTVLLGTGLVVLAAVRLDTVRKHVGKLVGSVAIGTAVAAPLLVPMMLAIAADKVAEEPQTSASLRDSSSPLSWVVPPLERLWVGRHLPSIGRLTESWEGVAFPGLVMLALAIAGVSLTAAHRRRGWAAMTLVAFVLSLGPYLFVRNTALYVPLPFFAVRVIPGLDAMRVPGRFGLLGSLGVHVLAALCLADIARRFPRRAALVVGLAGAVTILELYPRALPSRNDAVPVAYEAIAADPSHGAVLEIPLKWSTTQEHHGFEGQDQDFRFLLYQLVHERPIVSGAVSRFPDDALSELKSVPLYRQVLALAGQQGFNDPARFDEADLADLGIEFVVYHHDDPAPRVLRYLQSLDLAVFADDREVIVWKVDP